MAAPKETVWKLEPHTRAKHEILRRYLQAWMVILSQGKFPEILYIDGFSGPGEYEGGEVGSPIIALETAVGYKPPLTAKVSFLFVEKDQARADHLRGRVNTIALPAHFTVIIEGGTTFECAFNKHYPNFVRSGRGLVPTFAFIDPFGWTGAPFSIVQKIMANPSCEVFVNFMYEEVNRHLRHPDQGTNFDSFFGTTAWADRPDNASAQVRNRWLHDLYMRQLTEAAGVRFVRSFEMFNDRNVTDYFLFYATNQLLGLKKMKEAMWKLDESGEFKFSDATDLNQLVLFEKKPDLPILRGQIGNAFGGREVTLREIEDFVVVKTPFRETHYKGVLKDLEAAGSLDVVKAKPGRKRGTFPDRDMIVRFKIK
jgi:three-Cys-motif partner protein